MSGLVEGISAPYAVHYIHPTYRGRKSAVDASHPEPGRRGGRKAHMGFNLGNAVKYIWRADEKGNAVEDLRKAAWYVQREIDRRTGPDYCNGAEPLDSESTGKALW